MWHSIKSRRHISLLPKVWGIGLAVKMLPSGMPPKERREMSEYEKQRDAAAEKYIDVCCYRKFPNNFKAGADWANARAEKRIQELEEKLKAIIANYKNLADYSRGKSKTIEMLLKRLNSKQEKLQGLEDHIDLMVDEFKRISVEAKSLPVSLPSIYGESIIQLCERAVSNTKQHIPVIVQRDRAQEKIQSLEQKLTNQEQLNQKLAEGNSVLYEQKAELEKQVQGLVDALKDVFNTPPDRAEHLDFPTAKQALKEWQEGEAPEPESE